MANRRFRSQFLFGFEGKPVKLHAYVTFGTTGAPTLDSVNSKGISSIVRNSAGNYTITLHDSYVKLLGVDYMPVVSTGAAAAPLVQVVSSSVSSSPATIVIQCLNTAGTATDPASGEASYITIELGDSTAV